MTSRIPTLADGLCICRDKNCKIPYGLCHCGCGEPTGIAKNSKACIGHICGMPKRYICGHHGRQRPQIVEAVPFKIDGELCRVIPLSQGAITIVSAIDYEYFMQWRWWARWNVNGFRAERAEYPNPRKRRAIYLHNEVAKRMGSESSIDHDHRNRNTLDNRRGNLREASRDQQVQNRGKSKANRSGYIGVHWCSVGKYFVASIGVNKKKLRLGGFSTAIEAARVRDEAAKQHHGEFAVLNFPD